MVGISERLRVRVRLRTRWRLLLSVFQWLGVRLRIRWSSWHRFCFIFRFVCVWVLRIYAVGWVTSGWLGGFLIGIRLNGREQYETYSRLGTTQQSLQRAKLSVFLKKFILEHSYIASLPLFTLLHQFSMVFLQLAKFFVQSLGKIWTVWQLKRIRCVLRRWFFRQSSSAALRVVNFASPVAFPAIKSQSWRKQRPELVDSLKDHLFLLTHVQTGPVQLLECIRHYSARKLTRDTRTSSSVLTAARDVAKSSFFATRASVAAERRERLA